MVALGKRGGRKWLLSLAIFALVAAVALGVFLTTAGAQESFTNRRTLARDIVKLAIVVMANQTSISAVEAQSVLPVLQAIRTQDAFTEDSALTWDGKLHSALSPSLESAVDVVRLPDMRSDVQAMLKDPAKMSRLQQWLARRRMQHLAKNGLVARAFDHLIAFFAETASTK